MFFFVSSLWATNVKIHLYILKEKGEDNRSMVPRLSASHDESTIYLYSDTPIDGLLVNIKDRTGQIVSSEIVPISPQQPYIFSIGEKEKGVYILELNDGRKEYYGYFEIY